MIGTKGRQAARRTEVDDLVPVQRPIEGHQLQIAVVEKEAGVILHEVGIAGETGKICRTQGFMGVSMPELEAGVGLKVHEEAGLIVVVEARAVMVPLCSVEGLRTIGGKDFPLRTEGVRTKLALVTIIGPLEKPSERNEVLG